MNSIVARAILISLFLGLAIVTQGRTEDYYIYQTADGDLVISNKQPPPGSKIIKQQPGETAPAKSPARRSQTYRQKTHEAHQETSRRVQPTLTIIALSLWLILILGLTCVVFSLVSMWKENRFGWPLKGVIWFTLAIIGSCAVIAFSPVIQKARSLEKVSRRVEAVTGLSALLFKL